MKRKAWLIDSALAKKTDYTPDTEAKEDNSLVREYASLEFIPLAYNDQKKCAVIRVVNGLSSEFEWFGIDYKSLAFALERAESDPDVEVIAFDINSPGGEVDGLFDLCEQIRACDKPTYAFTSGMICSAAYAIASATDRIFATESSSIGSIGVYMGFIDDSEYLKKNGIEEIYFYGQNSDKKNLDPKSKEGKEVYQNEVNALEEIFINNIANYRGVTPDYVLSNYGHGQVFLGQEALERGLVDEIVLSFDEYISSITSQKGEDKSMSKDAKEETKVMATSLENISPELLTQIQAEAAEKAKAEALQGAEEKDKQAREQAVAQERERVAALDKYANLPQPEIKALAEQAKADGTSVEDFEKSFNEKAFEILKENKFAEVNPQTQALLDEVKDSAGIQANVEGTQIPETDKSAKEKAIEAGKAVAEKFKNK